MTIYCLHNIHYLLYWTSPKLLFNIQYPYIKFSNFMNIISQANSHFCPISFILFRNKFINSNNFKSVFFQPKINHFFSVTSYIPMPFKVIFNNCLVFLRSQEFFNICLKSMNECNPRDKKFSLSQNQWKQL